MNSRIEIWQSYGLLFYIDFVSSQFKFMPLVAVSVSVYVSVYVYVCAVR